MLIANTTRQTVLASDAVWAKSFVAKIFGLIFYSKPMTMVFKTRFGIHTLLMRRSIDVLVLNEKYEVVDMHPFMKPNKVFWWNLKYNLVIELPAGRIGESKTQFRDVLSFE